MKKKDDLIQRLLAFAGKKRWLLTVSHILSGISALFILIPYVCVYFAAK